MSHYFENDKTLKHQEKTFEFSIDHINIKLTSDLGVFSKSGLDYGTKVLVSHADFECKNCTIIDMGCGYGPIGLYLAKKYPSSNVFLYDVNERAVELAKKNIDLNQLKNAVVKQGYLFEHVNKQVDIIFTNPPIRAGKKVVFDLYHQAYEKLVNGGLFYVVIQKKQGAPSSVTELETLFGNVTILDKNKGYWILLARK